MRIGWRTDNPPDEKDNYLVQIQGEDIVVGWWTNANPFWADETTDWHWSGLPQFAKVVAWMPLPEPYREEQDHEHID